MTGLNTYHCILIYFRNYYFDLLNVDIENQEDEKTLENGKMLLALFCFLSESPVMDIQNVKTFLKATNPSFFIQTEEVLNTVAIVQSACLMIDDKGFENCAPNIGSYFENNKKISLFLNEKVYK